MSQSQNPTKKNIASRNNVSNNSEASTKSIPPDNSQEERQPKRMTVVLPYETSEMLNALSSLQSITLNEAIRRAISTESFIYNEIRQGSRILVETKDKETKELIFR